MSDPRGREPSPPPASPGGENPSESSSESLRAGDPLPSGVRTVPALARCGLAAARRPVLTLVIAGVLLAAAVAAALTLRLDTDLFAIVPPDDPAVAELLTSTERFGALDRLLVVFHLPPEADPAPYFGLADRVVGRMEQRDDIDWVEYRLKDTVAIAEEVLPFFTLLLAPEQVDRLADALSPEGLAAAAATTRRRVTSPEGLLARDRLRLDPFNLLPLVGERLSRGASLDLVDPESGYFVSPDRRLLVILAKPARPATDLDFAEALVAGIRGVVAEEVAAVREGLAEADRGAFDPRPALAGGHAVATLDSQRVKFDLSRNTTLALLAVGLFFLFSFRRLSAFWLAQAPIVVGLGLTLGLAAITVGRLSATTSSVAALLVGLAVDFSIVLLQRYGEERQRGASLEQGIAVALGNTGRGVAVGAFTTAATFFAFLFSHFQGLFELGWLAACGILLCLASVFFLLPALLALPISQRRSEGRNPFALRPLGSGRLVRVAMARPGLTIVVWLLLMAGSAAGISRIGFDNNLQAMRSEDNEATLTQREVAESFGVGLNAMILRVDAPDGAALLAEAHRLRARLAPLVADGTLAGVDSIADLVPPPDDQRRVAERLNAAGSTAFDPVRVLADGRAALAAQGLRPESFEVGLEGLAAALSPPPVIPLDELLEGSLGHYLSRYLARTETGWSTALYLLPPPERWKSFAPPAVHELVDSEPGASVTGLNVVSQALREVAWADLYRAAPIAMLLVWLLLIWDFRSAALGSLALLPVAPGILVLLGVAGWCGVRLSFINLFVLVMVLGIGVDYGVHMVHRSRESRASDRLAGQRLAGLGQTSRAVTMAAITTALGFGSLVLSGFNGLRSVGILAIAGALGSGLAALTLLPALLEKLQQRREQR